jgi:hypothetical protein
VCQRRDWGGPRGHKGVCAAVAASRAAAAAAPASYECGNPACGAACDGSTKCGGCASLRYCGTACAVAHYASHAAECTPDAARARVRAGEGELQGLGPIFALRLAQLRLEVNMKWPTRSKASDGWIGDAAHAARAQDLARTACTMSGAQFGGSTSALAKVAYDPGFALSDVLDARETYGMGIAMIALTSSPSLEVETADLTETLQSDWGDAEDNTVFGGALTVGINVGSNAINFVLTQPQLIQWPTPGESNGYRNIGLKFAGIVNASSDTAIGYIWFNSSPT